MDSSKAIEILKFSQQQAHSRIFHNNIPSKQQQEVIDYAITAIEERDRLKIQVANLQLYNDCGKEECACAEEYAFPCWKHLKEAYDRLKAEVEELTKHLDLAIKKLDMVDCFQGCGKTGGFQISEDEAEQCQWCGEIKQHKAIHKRIKEEL